MPQLWSALLTLSSLHPHRMHASTCIRPRTQRCTLYLPGWVISLFRFPISPPSPCCVARLGLATVCWMTDGRTFFELSHRRDGVDAYPNLHFARASAKY